MSASAVLRRIRASSETLTHLAAETVIWLQMVLLIPILLIVRLKRISPPRDAMSVALGGCGIINLKGWRDAIRSTGRNATTFVWSTPEIYSDGTFDYDLRAKFGRLAGVCAPYSFLKAVAANDCIICGFDGFVLGITTLRRFELRLIKLARCQLICVPYGGDAYIYSAVKNESLQHALQISYPRAARHQKSIANRVSRVIKVADFVIPGVMGLDGIGRWDLLTPNPLVIDVESWKSKTPKHLGDEMRVVHTPNHRGFKGTEFLVRAVSDLQDRGLNISLRLVEGLPNAEVKRILADETDVLVEQLIFCGYAMSALEGMAMGTVVVSNLEDSRICEPFRRWSFLSECPIVSSSPENIEETLEELYNSPELRRRLSRRSREFVIARHSYDSFAKLFVEIESFLRQQRLSLLNYYHPILGDSLKSSMTEVDAD